MVRYCSISGCNNRNYNSNSNVFYSFPAIRKNHYEITHLRYCRWLDALKIDDFTTESKRKSFFICQDHFISGLFKIFCTSMSCIIKLVIRCSALIMKVIVN